MAVEQFRLDRSPGEGPPPLLAMRGIRKSFGGAPVLHDVDLDLRQGEVLALLGENGAGKSTLIKILNGDYTRDAGQIYLNGEELPLRSPRDARQAGIQVIYQELNFAPDLSVAENVMLGHLPRRGGVWGAGGVVDWAATYQRTSAILATLNCPIPPGTPMANLGVGERQLVEIAKALSMEARVLVMDEPTAALTPREVRVLLSTIEALRTRGVGIIYISHRLDEVEQAAQRVMVLRDGRVAGVGDAADMDRRTIVRMMVGRELSAAPAVVRSAAAGNVLEVHGLGRRGVFADVSFAVGHGEIVGMFGLLGSGHLEVSRALFGVEPATEGTVILGTSRFRPRSPRQARALGFGLVPEDRKTEGFVAGMSLADNLTLGNWRGVSTAGVIQASRQVRRAADWIGRLTIRSKCGVASDIETMSGGNQQKVILARWLEAGVRVLLLNEPTRGVDVGARSDIYRLLDELRTGGMGVVLASSDLEEVLAASDRVLVFSKGRISGEFTRVTATPEKLLSAASGGGS